MINLTEASGGWWKDVDEKDELALLDVQPELEARHLLIKHLQRDLDPAVANDWKFNFHTYDNSNTLFQ
jgi:hypothetical protein